MVLHNQFPGPALAVKAHIQVIRPHTFRFRRLQRQVQQVFQFLIHNTLSVRVCPGICRFLLTEYALLLPNMPFSAIPENSRLPLRARHAPAHGKCPAYAGWADKKPFPYPREVLQCILPVPVPAPPALP